MDDGERRAGRPRDAEAGKAMKRAALRLVRERGYDSVSIGQIASVAGVARQSIYNRWPAKADLVLEAVFETGAGFDPPPVGTAPGPVAARLETFLLAVFDHVARDGETLAALIAAAQADAAFRQAFRDRFVLPREALVTDMLDEARRTGEIAPGRDPALISAMIHGAFWYRLLNGLPVDAQLARALCHEVFGSPSASRAGG
ncbi:TetR/AcrR family transcriptional regulator [Frigidibacter sp. MR17.24]|uniref:TetR/AcrR family transcriptional regulator n=1 Tax=Frigidibacter sp. MR17.24 TaxID=3127345 RepID=UPI003012B145